MPTGLDPRLARAVRHFWQTRRSQGSKQGAASGRRDQGSRTEVTGGKHLDGFASLLRNLLVKSGLPDAAILRQRSKVVLPGFFRPTKQWDLLVIVDGKLLGTLELKAHVGSFGNNANNRAEEALGNATDLWAAYKNGAFQPSPQPWLGYLVIVEEATASTRPIKPRSPHFPVFEEFQQASVHRAVRDTLHKACERAALHRRLLDRLGQGGWLTWPLPRALVGTEFRQFRRVA
jgi:hypothetical protein